MGDKLKLRTRIKNIFESVGAEVALYEKDLTPSVTPNTYRDDILQTDFVIFIIDERYGVQTESGLSGTEEEFNIISYNKKPCHVYLKKIDKTDNAERFEASIRSRGISYYYYSSESDLIKKLKSTCFTIARDIVFSNIDKQQVKPLLIKKAALRQDVEMGASFCSIMECAIEINNQTQFTFIDSNLMIQALGPAVHSILSESHSIYIDRKCNDLLCALCNQIVTFNNKISVEACPSALHTTLKFLNNELYLTNNQWATAIDVNWYKSQLDTIMNTYQQFKGYIAQLSLERELIPNII